MAELNDKTVEAIRALALKTGIPMSVPNGNVPFAIIPNDCRVQDLSSLIYNDHQSAPERKKGTVEVLDAESFCEYWTLFSDLNSRAFAYEPAAKVTGILDYHGAGTDGGPRWGQHRVVLALQESHDWQIWNRFDNAQMTQEEFGEFLEQRALDIAHPKPADMLQVAKDLEATTEVEFGSALRAQDGQVRFRYTEQTKATVGASQISVPEQFIVRIPVFVGSEPVSVGALLRFRVKEGKLKFWYTLVRPEKARRTAFLQIRQSIATKLNIAIINGALVE